MIDNEYSRTKMRGYCMALRYVINFINTDDDPNTLCADLKDKLAAIEKEWNLKPKKADRLVQG